MITRASREPMAMFISFIGISALLYELHPRLVAGTFGLLLIGGVVLSAILTVVVDVRHGASLTKSLIGIFIAGAITFGLVYGVMWYYLSGFIR